MGFRRLPAVLPLLISSLVIGYPNFTGHQPAAVAAATPARSSSPGLAGPADLTTADSRSATFGPVSLRVPAAWPVVSLTRHPAACPQLNRHAVYLGTPGPDPSCPAELLAGKTESVQLMPIDPASPDVRAASRPTKVGGLPALTNPDSAVTHTIIDIIPAAGTEVSLSYGTNQALVRAIQGSIRVSAAARTQPEMTTVIPAPVPAVAQQGLYQGSGFDTCAAPSAATMRHWLASPYRAIGIYIGGVNRACAQGNLTAGWIAAIQKEGWHYFPLYVGLQASCVDAFGDSPIVTSKAAAEGTAAARDAAAQAADLGIPAGTPLIYDMEAYGTGCSKQVVTFLSAWDTQLHARGYQAGVYESFSNIGDLVRAQGKMVEPDVIHYADWDGQATTDSSYMPATMWTDHQRLHQYTGGSNLTWGGATLNVDLDQLDVNLAGQSGPTPPPTPAPPPPLPPMFRLAIAMNSNGGAEWFGRGANGTIRHAWQHPLGTTNWTRTVAVGSSPRNLVSNPAVTADHNGRLTLFAVDRDDLVIHAWQHQGAPNDWQWGGPAGAGKAGKLAGDPSATQGTGGRVAVFIDNSRGAVLTTRQLAPDDNTGWTHWTSIGGACASSPVAETADGTVQVFCITRTHALAVTAQAAGGWQRWRTVPGLIRLTGVPAAAAADGTTEVFATTTSGQVYVARQASPGAAWTTADGPPAAQQVHGSPAVTTWPGGGFAVFTQLAGGHVGYAVQPGPAASWSGWTSLGSTVIGVPVAWVSSSGSPAAAVLDANRKVAIANYTAGGWTSWLELGAGF
jgi:glycoside hydrolase-like protein